MHYLNATNGAILMILCMTNNEYNALTSGEKNFIRLLKELGIYSMWAFDRKKTMLECDIKNHIPKVANVRNCHFSTVISYSIAVSLSNHCKIWDSIICECKYSVNEILANENLFKHVENIINSKK